MLEMSSEFGEDRIKRTHRRRYCHGHAPECRETQQGCSAMRLDTNATTLPINAFVCVHMIRLRLSVERGMTGNSLFAEVNRQRPDAGEDAQPAPVDLLLG